MLLTMQLTFLYFVTSIVKLLIIIYFKEPDDNTIYLIYMIVNQLKKLIIMHVYEILFSVFSV